MFPSTAEEAANKLLDDAISLAKERNSSRYVLTVDWQEPVRKNLIYHVWPVVGRWQHHIGRVLASVDQFNGKRILGIVTDENTDTADAVKDYIKGHGFEFVVKKNRSRYREGVTFIPMLELVESTNRNEVTFFGHSKGVRHENIGAGSTIGLWADAMYRTVYDDLGRGKRSIENQGNGRIV